MLKKFLQADAEPQMADYLGLKWHERGKPVERADYRNGFYERDYVTPLSIVRLRIPRTRFRFHWRSRYPAMVRQPERDLPELLHFFVFPRPLRRKPTTTNVIECCFVEVRPCTRPMVDTLELFTQAA